MKTARRLGFVLVLIGIVSAAPSGACRFWGFVGHDYPQAMIADHLRDGTVTNLRDLGGMNRDGWGLGFFLPAGSPVPLNGPVIRRGGPPANHATDPEFGLAVDELSAVRPRAAIGHVRAGTSGHWGIPNPHPFLHEGLLFAHNGTVSEDRMVELLLSGDVNYLDEHPPDYVEGNIDSELYFLYLLKYRHANPKLSPAEAIRQAVLQIEEAGGLTRLNFVMTAGDTLYVLRNAPFDSYDAVRYFPAGAVASPYWIAASEIVGSNIEGWGTIPARTLALFVPGRAPRFIAVDGDTTPIPDPDIARAVPAHPNPMRTRLAVPVTIPAGGASVTFEIWDARGREVFRAGPKWTEAGEAEVVWDGRDRAGEDVASGTYFCRVWIGGEGREQRITVLR
jgi:predicted glutamine amidotransferase